MGFPTEPRLERRRLCGERFTIEKWNQLAGYSALSGAPPMVAPLVPPRQSRASSPQRLYHQCPYLRLLMLLRLWLLRFHQSRLLHPSLPLPYLLQSFVPLCIPFKHSPPPILLYSSRWLKCMPIRTNRLLFSARFSTTWDFYLRLNLTFPHHQSL